MLAPTDRSYFPLADFPKAAEIYGYSSSDLCCRRKCYPQAKCGHDQIGQSDIFVVLWLGNVSFRKPPFFNGLVHFWPFLDLFFGPFRASLGLFITCQILMKKKLHKSPARPKRRRGVSLMEPVH